MAHPRPPDDWPEHYPLANPERRTVELTGYEPLSMAQVERLAARDEWRATR